MTIILFPGPQPPKNAGQRYRECCKDIFPCFGKLKKGVMYVFLSTCERDFSCARCGKDEWRRHVKSKSHLYFKKLKMTEKPLSSFCKTTEFDRTLAVTKAEAMIVQTDNNIDFIVVKCQTFFKVIFPGSKIASAEKNV